MLKLIVTNQTVMRAYLLIVLLSLFAQPLLSQELPRWRPGNVGLQLGLNSDRYAAMSMDYMRAYAKQTSLIDLELGAMQQEVISRVEGGMMVLSVGLHPLSQDGNTYNLNHELRFALELHAGRESMILWNEAGSSNSLIYCVIQNEAALNAAYLFRHSRFGIIEFYGGLGAGLGKTFGNEFIFINDTDRSFAGEQNTVYNESVFRAVGSSFYRVYVPAGMDLRVFGKLKVNVEARYGVGAEKVKDDRLYMIPGTFAAIVGMKYLI